jgi:hypothetical protein
MCRRFNQREVGRPRASTRNLLREHDLIELFQKSSYRVFEICAPLYAKGHSLKEIAKLTGIPYTSIQSQFVQNGVTLRNNRSGSNLEALRQGIRSGAPPVYGFRVIAARLEKDPIEYPILLAIHQQWRSGQSATTIMHFLNNKKLKTRNQKAWKRTTVLNIINRFESGSFIPG